jgi:hypothetical protein
MDRFPRGPCVCGKLIIAVGSRKPTQSIVAFDADRRAVNCSFSVSQYWELIPIQKTVEFHQSYFRIDLI